MESAALACDVALVVPVLDDDRALQALLARVDAWPRRPREIVVVAGSVSAGLRDICARPDCRLLEADPNRGAQLDHGARTASATVLWFVHADAAPPDDGIAAIERALATGADSGCFRFAFQGPRRRYKRLLEQLVAWRVRLGGMPYGDQGIFVRRDVYVAAGGFAHQSLFEEVRLVKRLKQRGTFCRLSDAIGVSTRRWERDGWWSRSCHNRWLALCYMLGVPAERLAGRYGKPRTRMENEL